MQIYFDPLNGWLAMAPSAGTGATGASGPVGPPGMDGADGEDGGLGPPGPAGATGAAGAPGATGAAGAVGAIGLDGIDGEDGLLGPPGLTGATGLQGASLMGIDGADGEDGLIGPQGATGATGATGAQGPAATLPTIGTAFADIPRPRRSGTLYLDGRYLPSQIGKPTFVQQAPMSTEEECIQLFCAGEVISTTQIRVRWISPMGLAVGRKKFNYLISM